VISATTGFRGQPIGSSSDFGSAGSCRKGSPASTASGRLGRERAIYARIFTAIDTCRTAALGGHIEHCDACGLTQSRRDISPLQSGRNPLFVDVQPNKLSMFHEARLLCMRLCAGSPA
jgi:hypothetical protein